MKSLLIRAPLAAVLAAACCFPSPAAERPNILFFLVDDMGIADTSEPFLYNHKGEQVDMPLNQRYRTPAIERLARQGLKFTNAYAYSVCSPTRTSLITGQAAERLRITTWTHPKQVRDTGTYNSDALKSAAWQMAGVDPGMQTLPRLLADAGYRTIHCGKAHFGPDEGPAGDPTKLGFEVNIAGYGGGGPGSYWGEKNYSAEWRSGQTMWDVPGLEKFHGTETFLSEALTLEMKDALDKSVRDEKPFFAYMSHYAVHSPFETDARFAANYPGLDGKDLAFATLIEGMDKSLGDLLDHLEKLGVAEDTLVVFYSDNGSDGPPNLPLRGIKGSRFEGGCRVPLVVAWAKPNPNHPLQRKLAIPIDSRNDSMVVPMDFMPTLLRLTNTPAPVGQVMDGRDISPILKGLPGTPTNNEFIVHFPHGQHRSNMFTTMVAGGYKVTYEYATRKWHLVNLADDPYETENRVGRDPAAAFGLAQRMIETLERRGASFPRDAGTGKELKPDLELLREAARQATPAPAPPARDDLNL